MNDKILNSQENIHNIHNKVCKVSRTKKLVFISLGLIVTGILLFSLSLMGLNHTAIDQPINNVITDIFRFIGI